MEQTENSIYLTSANSLVKYPAEKPQFAENISALITHELRDADSTDLPMHQLPQREQLLQSVLSHAPIVLFSLDCSGIFTFSEGRALQALGVQPGEVVGASIFEIYRDFPNIINSVCRSLDGETTTSTNKVSGRVFETLFTPIRDADAQVTGIIGVATDISERIEAENALRSSQEKFRALSEYASDLVLMLDASGVFQYASPSHQRIMGYSPEELVGKNVFELMHPSDKKKVLNIWATAFHSAGETVRVECRLRHANGSWLTLEAVGR